MAALRTRVLLCARDVTSSQYACTFPAPAMLTGTKFIPKDEHWLVYLTWTTSLLLSDPKGSYWHRNHTRLRPITPIISLNDVNAWPCHARVRQDEKAAIRFLIMSEVVEPNGFEPMTSCLQSRRSTN